MTSTARLSRRERSVDRSRAWRFSPSLVVSVFVHESKSALPLGVKPVCGPSRATQGHCCREWILCRQATCRPEPSMPMFTACDPGDGMHDTATRRTPQSWTACRERMPRSLRRGYIRGPSTNDLVSTAVVGGCTVGGSSFLTRVSTITTCRQRAELGGDAFRSLLTAASPKSSMRCLRSNRRTFA